MIENPYHLRRRALDESLQPEEFSRALLHLNQRRGFKSNKKARGEEDKEQQGIKEEIQGLEKEMIEANARTLGEYFSINAETMKIRTRHTSRAMYLDEFEKIWDAQAAFNPIWTDQLKTLVRETIFHQRPLKSQSHLIGNCELEPDEPRCPKASWFAQQYRVLCDLNNLLVLTPYGERPLSPEERERLYEKLMTQVTDLKIDAIKEKILGLSALESLNFERTKRDSFPGNFVEARLRRLFKKEFDEKARWLRETAWGNFDSRRAGRIRGLRPKMGADGCAN